MTPAERREYGSGGITFAHRPTCPPDCAKPKDGEHRRPDCRGYYIGTIEAGWTRTGARRRLTVTGKTEAEAKRKLRDKRAKIDREGLTDAGSRTTVKAWAETWLADRATKDRPKTHTTDRGAVEAWIVPTIGHKRLEQLTPADVRAVSTALRQAGKETSTMRRYHGVLIRMLKAAVQEGVNIPSRVLTVDPPKTNVHDRQALPLEDAWAILRAAANLPDGDTRWAMALVQGMRQGECLGLTREAIRDGYVEVSWQLQSIPYRDKSDRRKGFLIPDGYEARHLEQSWHLVRPKSDAGWRVIPLVPALRVALEAWLEVAPPSRHGLVWPRPDGGPRRIKDDTAEWQAIQDAAEVRHPSGRYYHVHELRNTTATILLDMEVPESVRIAIMGHSNISVTRGYETVSKALALDALTKVSDRLGLSG